MGEWTVGTYQNVEHRLVPPAHAYPVRGEFGNIAFVIGSEEEARLIASAPDLLAALEAIVRQAEPLYAAVPDSPATHSAHVLMDEARAAIAKATGKDA